MRAGVRLGIDVGKARVGVARCDPHAMLATPVETVPRDLGGDADLIRIEQIATELGAMETVVGLPLNMRGERTLSTDDAVEFAERLAVRLAPAGITVRLVDERLSTVSAQGQLRQAGKKTKQSRGIIDQAAAVVILQHALDTERARGTAPGEAVEVIETGDGAEAGDAAVAAEAAQRSEGTPA
ncbi:Holliday junction resolvase RuvX [Leucobacter sp. HY1908]